MRAGTRGSGDLVHTRSREAGQAHCPPNGEVARLQPAAGSYPFVRAGLGDEERAGMLVAGLPRCLVRTHLHEGGWVLHACPMMR